jgi:hypothetical protein
LAIAALAALVTTTVHRTAPAEAADCNKIAFPATLQPLIDSSRPGDVICLVGDVFRGPVLFAGKSGVTLRGAGARQTIIAGGERDALLVFDSRGLTFEDLTLYLGHPANAYIHDSTEIDFTRVDVGGGGLGIHYDVGSRGRVTDSFVYAMEGDGILSRRGSNVTVERNWVFVNGGPPSRRPRTRPSSATSSPTTRARESSAARRRAPCCRPASSRCPTATSATCRASSVTRTSSWIRT